jgi:hypothetical protein
MPDDRRGLEGAEVVSEYSMLGRWDGVWGPPFNEGQQFNGGAGAGQVRDETTYRTVAIWLNDDHCDHIEDWGCGDTYIKKFLTCSRYVGVDGSRGPADVIADLQKYRSTCDAVILRHVLEHNRNWRTILRNALDSAQKRVALVLFIPWHDYEEEINEAGGPIPDIALTRAGVYSCFDDRWTVVNDLAFKTRTQYGFERLICLERR